MSDPIKHHYVPRFMLRAFAEGKKNKARIWTLDKATRKTFRGSVIDAGHENFFYRATNVDGETIDIEKLLGNADNRGATAIRYVLEKQILPDDSEAIVAIAYTVAAQMLRVPHVRNEMREVRLKVLEKWGPQVHAGDDPRTIAEYSDEDDRFASLTVLTSVPEFARHIGDKVWFLLKAPTGHFFTLSDNPVVRHNHLDYGPRGSLGIAQDGIEIFMPISPEYCLQFLCPKIADLVARNPRFTLMMQAQQLRRPVLLEPENVTFVNSMQVLHSERYIYAKDEAHFALAKEMLAENPNAQERASALDRKAWV